MNPRVTAVKPLADYRLELLFSSQERKIFDVKPYLSIGVFQALQKNELFMQARPFSGTVVWPDDIDLDPDTLYLDSCPIH